jgi:hypothetical protein
VVARVVDNNGDVSFAGTMYRAGRACGEKQVEVSIVAGSVQIACAGTIVRPHAIRHDRAKKHGVVVWFLVGPGFGPFVVLFGEYGAEESDQGVANRGKMPTTSVRRRVPY